MGAPLITLLTDFGTGDGYVGIMKGVILGICRSARLIDLSHDVPRQKVVAGALVLRYAVEYFPAATVHLAVVDPGVGSERAPLLVVTERGMLVGPDNGLLAPAAHLLGFREARRLEARRFFRPTTSRTFHGRDIFAPVAAHLAAGVSPESFGPVVEMCSLVLAAARREPSAIAGEVLYVDHFGNLITNITAEALADLGGSSLVAELPGGRNVRLVEAYAGVSPGEPLAVINSWGCLEIAIRDGNAAQVLSAGSGTTVVVKVQQSAVGSRQSSRGNDL